MLCIKPSQLKYTIWAAIRGLVPAEDECSINHATDVDNVLLQVIRGAISLGRDESKSKISREE